jgi:mRNA-degrading endonuclease RelE of RelBE toxin-antitoxin system
MKSIEWKRKALKQLRKIPNPAKTLITEKVGTLEVIDTAANVKKLIGHQYDYRLRVGDYRIFFNHAALIEIVFIEEVKKRDERTY